MTKKDGQAQCTEFPGILPAKLERIRWKEGTTRFRKINLAVDSDNCFLPYRRQTMEDFSKN